MHVLEFPTIGLRPVAVVGVGYILEGWHGAEDGINARALCPWPPLGPR